MLRRSRRRKTQSLKPRRSSRLDQPKKNCTPSGQRAGGRSLLTSDGSPSRLSSLPLSCPGSGLSLTKSTSLPRSCPRFRAPPTAVAIPRDDTPRAVQFRSPGSDRPASEPARQRAGETRSGRRCEGGRRSRIVRRPRENRVRRAERVSGPALSARGLTAREQSGAFGLRFANHYMMVI